MPLGKKPRGKIKKRKKKKQKVKQRKRHTGTQKEYWSQMLICMSCSEDQLFFLYWQRLIFKKRRKCRYGYKK